MRRRLEIIGLFCKRALQKRLYSAKETYDLKEPTNRSHPINWVASWFSRILVLQSLYTVQYIEYELSFKNFTRQNRTRAQVQTLQHPETHWQNTTPPYKTLQQIEEYELRVKFSFFLLNFFWVGTCESDSRTGTSSATFAM